MTAIDYLAVAFCALLGLEIWRRTKHSKLPPGPPGGLFGNIHHIPKTESWKVFKKLSQTYGPVMCFWMFNGKTIILNDYKTADDLLNHRSAIYSSRPTFWMSGYLGKRDNSVFVTKTSNPRFKIYRTLLHKTMNQRAIQSYRDLQIDECNILLKGLLETPHEYITHIRRNAVSMIMSVAYGYHVESTTDKFVSALEDNMRLLGALNVPGKYWIEFFPFLRFIPDWFPGASFKRIAHEGGDKLSENEGRPFLWTKSQMASGSYQDSFVSDHLTSEEQFASSQDEQEDIIRLCSASLYTGGGDTTVSGVTSLFFVMAQYPAVQERARDEIDRVVGDRMVTHQDMSSLPYVNAMIKEITRWGSIVPLGITHQVTEDNSYNGYYIPKGARVMANIWAMAHDENVYSDPDVFDPERFMGKDPQQDPYDYVFGFGRRICPGMHLAQAALFLNTANILANFIISKEVGKDGREIEPEMDWVGPVVAHLRRFPCQITPRSPGALRAALQD